MKASCLFISVLSFFASASAFAAEAGIGREVDTPDAPPPTDPVSAEATESVLQQLLESFGLAG